MSISRKNWSALSSLARQMTMEDEEEVERERRRRVKSSTSAADPEAPQDAPTSDSPFGTDSTNETSQGLSSGEQIQLDFVEMLRVRDEKRRMRHVETLRRQKEEEEDESEANIGGGRGGGGEARVELLGDANEEPSNVFLPVRSTSKPQPLPKPASDSPSSSNTSTDIANRQHENGQSPREDPDPTALSPRRRKFVSSVSISLDKSPSISGRTTPMSPCSPTALRSPQEHFPSPCRSPSPTGAQGPVQNGSTQEANKNDSFSNGNFEQKTKPALVRQSSRTISFRMMRKKEEDSSPLQRSASVRVATKKFECNTDRKENEDKPSSFERNSRQRISSRSIQEKMEKLAQAAQKSDTLRSPDVTQRTLFLLEEVTRKRGLFEKEQQEAAPASPGVSRQESQSFTSGMSHRINRWLNKTNQTGPSHSPTDLRHVDISSKRSLFENKGEDSVSKVPSKK
ncbi:ladinin-1-like isoform X1 [Platichthys flesus]|uniref:ladinin-1-like isoform X1 n=1 Tax=Platichthys flesus TaxID=8260 RepID=UPI002DC03139|nr:ladinin-1-like isoform X1 [Platichthys flesus]